VDEVRDDFVLQKDLVDLYLQPLEQHGDKQWRGEHIGKWLDAASSQWKYTKDSRIRELMDEAISRMLAVQAPNGWLGSYDEPYRFYQLNWNGLGRPSAWDTYYGWDLWCNFMSMEGLLKYHWAVTNENRALNAACRIGDLIIQTFGEGKQDLMLVPHDNGTGAMTLLLGFAHLYEASGEVRYLRFCEYMMCQFGRPGTLPIILAGTYGAEADRFPFSQEGAVVKHTETELILSGLCELYRITGEPALLATCRNVYDGGFAPFIQSLCFSGYTSPTIQFEVPRAVRQKVELCDTPAMLRWWAEMFRLTGEPRFLNAIERQVYNQLLAHRTLTGFCFPYMPSQHFDSPSGCQRRYGSLGPFDCCSSMGPVGFGDLPGWCYFTSRDGILVNFYEPSTVACNIGSVPVKLEQETDYPVDGSVKIGVNPEKPVTFDLQLRMPDWVAPELTPVPPLHRMERGQGEINGTPVLTSLIPLSIGWRGGNPSGYGVRVAVNGETWGLTPKPGTILSIKREWRPGDRVTLELPMTARVSCPVESAPGYCSIERGPLVLAMTERLNETGDGWCYAAPLLDDQGGLQLETIRLNDPAGQASVGWRMKSTSRFEILGDILQATNPVTLVPFSDAGVEGEPYVAAFPLPETLKSLPPRLGPGAYPDLGQIKSGASAYADSELNDETDASRAIDGNQTTAWRAASTPYPHWLEIKLPKRERVGRIIIRFGDRRDHPVDFRLLAAKSGGDLVEILAVKGCNLSDYYWAKIEPLETDSLRLVLEKSSGDSTDAPISEIAVSKE
jgi:DUF1680 family protein